MDSEQCNSGEVVCSGLETPPLPRIGNISFACVDIINPKNSITSLSSFKNGPRRSEVDWDRVYSLPNPLTN